MSYAFSDLKPDFRLVSVQILLENVALSETVEVMDPNLYLTARFDQKRVLHAVFVVYVLQGLYM